MRPAPSDAAARAPDALERFGYRLRWLVPPWLLGVWIYWGYLVLKVGAPRSSITLRLDALFGTIKEWLPF